MGGFRWNVAAIVLLVAVVNGFSSVATWCPQITRIPGYFNVPFWMTEQYMQIAMIMAINGLAQLFLGLFIIYPQFFAPCLPLAKRLPTGKMSHMRTYIACNAFASMGFSFALIWQLNYYVVIIATLHNWFEWQVLGVIYLGSDMDRKSNGCFFTRRHFNITFLVYIFYVVQLTGLHVTNFTLGLFIVEILGLHCDAQLFLTACYKLCADKAENRSLNIKFFVATLSHMLMIGVLFMVIDGYILQYPFGTLFMALLLYISSISYALYALDHDLMIEDEMKKLNDGDVENEAEDKESQNSKQLDAESDLAHKQNSVDTPIHALPMAIIMVVGFAMGATALISAVKGLDVCPAVKILQDEVTWVTYVDIDDANVEAMHNQIIQMKKEAMSDVHNQWYRVFEGDAANMINPNGEFYSYSYTKFLVYEKWGNEKARAVFHKKYIDFYDNIKTMSRGYEIMNPDDDVVVIPPTKDLVKNYEVSDISSDTVCESDYRVGTTLMSLKPTGWWEAFSTQFMVVAKESRKQDYNVFYIPLLAYHANMEADDPNEPNTDMFLIESYKTAADFFEHFMTRDVIVFGAIMSESLQIAALYGPFNELDMYSHC